MHPVLPKPSNPKQHTWKLTHADDKIIHFDMAALVEVKGDLVTILRT